MKPIYITLLVLALCMGTVTIAHAEDKCNPQTGTGICPVNPLNVGQLESPIPSPSRQYEDLTATTFLDAWGKMKPADAMEHRNMVATYGAAQQAVTRFIQQHPNYRQRYPLTNRRVQARNQWHKR